MPEQNKQEFNELSTSIYRHQQERQIGIKQQTILSILATRFKRDLLSCFPLRYIYGPNGISFYKEEYCVAGWILFSFSLFHSLSPEPAPIQVHQPSPDFIHCHISPSLSLLFAPL